MVSISYIILLFGGTLIGRILCGTTIQQYQEAGRMMRSICEPKFKLTPELIAALEAKQTPDDRTLKCFVNCVFETSKAMKRGKYNLDIALKQVDMMVPDELKEDYKRGMTICKDSGQGMKDPCDISYEFFKCLLKETPTFITP